MTETASTDFSIYTSLHFDISTYSNKIKLSCERTPAVPETDGRSQPIIAVVFYSTYGHIEQLAEGIIKGVEATGAEVRPYVL